MQSISDGAARDTESRERVRHIIARIERAMRLVRTTATETLLRAGVSMSHLQVIWQLECSGGELPMGRLAEQIGISESTVTGLIDRMEERGLVVRVRPAGDRRTILIRPTEAGIEAAREMELLRTELTEATLDRLDERQLARLAAGLADWAEALEIVMNERGADRLPTPTRS